ncbi:hypothetical protein NC652_007428 [Populus alba x Populus x berolinensis]|nr:hypothetical protein NC652_007428 [Populus alba x Populus x berolinensis]
MAWLSNSPLTPVFQTVLVYFRPDTRLLETVKHNLRWYRLPSLRVKRLLLFELLLNGNGNTRSGRPGHKIERLSIFTSERVLTAADIFLFHQGFHHLMLRKQMQRWDFGGCEVVVTRDTGPERQRKGWMGYIKLKEEPLKWRQVGQS